MGGLGRSKYGKFWSHKWAMPPFRHFCTNRHEFWYPGLKLNFTATLFYKKNHFDRPFPPLTNPPPVAQKQPKVALFFCCESPSWHYVSVMMLIVMISESDSFVGSSDDLLGSRQTLPWELISVGLSCSWHLMQRWHLQKHILIFNKKFVSRALQSRPRRALSLGPFPTPSRARSRTRKSHRLCVLQLICFVQTDFLNVGRPTNLSDFWCISPSPSEVGWDLSQHHSVCRKKIGKSLD